MNKTHFNCHPNTQLFTYGQNSKAEVESCYNAHLDGHLQGVIIPKDDFRLAFTTIFYAVDRGLPFSLFGSGFNAQRIPFPHDTSALTLFECESSGSSGTPKPIRRSHASWIASFHVNAKHLVIDDTDSYAIFGALNHSLTLYALMEAAHIGAQIHVLESLTPNKQWQILEQNSITVLYATPTQLRLLLSSKQARSKDTILNVKHIMSGGGKIDHLTQQALRTHFPKAKFHEFYGTSEMSFVTLSDRGTPPLSVGKPFPDVELMIDTSHSQDETGDIWVKSPYLFSGYGLVESHDCKWQNGFLNVGDRGYFDNEGFVFLSGRKNRMVTIADQNVFPETIEKVIMEFNEIEYCAVVPKNNHNRGHVLHAYISARTKYTSALKQSLLAHIRKQLGARHVPERIILLDDFPLLPSGKPDLVNLADDLMNHD